MQKKCSCHTATEKNEKNISTFGFIFLYPYWSGFRFLSYIRLLLYDIYVLLFAIDHHLLLKGSIPGERSQLSGQWNDYGDSLITSRCQQGPQMNCRWVGQGQGIGLRCT